MKSVCKDAQVSSLFYTHERQRRAEEVELLREETESRVARGDRLQAAAGREWSWRTGGTGETAVKNKKHTSKQRL